jgi:signal peptidase I
MGFIILIALVTILTGLIIGGGLLVWITKLFKVENPSYKKSLIVLIVSYLASVVAGFIFSIINLGLLSNILVSVATFFVFHYLYKKYYQSSWKKSLGIYIVFGIAGAILALLVVIPTRVYVFEPFTVAGASMSPTYNNGDYLLVNKFDKSFQRGDVVVFRFPKDAGQFFIKRIIGLPSEKVDIQNGKVLVNGQVLSENYYSGETLPDSSITLGQDQYFVLGDNRNQSFDSRNFGPITTSSIQGKIFDKVSYSAK